MINAYHIQLLEFSLLSAHIMETSIVYMPTIFTGFMFYYYFKKHMYLQMTQLLGFQDLKLTLYLVSTQKCLTNMLPSILNRTEFYRQYIKYKKNIA